MNKEQEKLFWVWINEKERKIPCSVGWLITGEGPYNEPMETLCKEAFVAGLNICTCDDCIRHHSHYFDVEKYYE